MISCPNCGGNPRFDIASQKLLCQFCGSSYDIESFPEEIPAAAPGEREDGDGETVEKMQVTVYTCSQCGGELMSTDSDATAFCSYCGAHQVLEERLSFQERPKRIIPFRITKEDCKNIYAKKLRRSLFAPKELRDPAYIDEFRGIYMPYWFYSFTQKGKVTLTGTTEHRDGNYNVIDSYKLTVKEDNVFNGITHDASTSFDDKISESLAPYDTRETVSFKTAYLSGFYADIPDVTNTAYQREAEVMVARDTLEKIEGIKDFKKYSIKESDDNAAVSKTNTELQSAETAMFPVWFLSYRKNDRMAYAAINGQTGKMTADIPIDKVRYLTGTAVMAAVIWIILQTFNIASLQGILMAVIFGSMAGALVYGMVVHKLQEDQNNRDWEAYLGNREKKEQEGKKASGPPERKHISPGILETLVLWLILIVIAGVLMIVELGGLIMIEPLLTALYVQLGFDAEKGKRRWISNWALGIVTSIGALVWVLNPYIDILYYGCSVLMMICVVWCFFDALYYYNQLMTRPLPQFNKKGGDDRA
ncbi:MAG: hypothetical protein J5966_04420 [Lachnospiraceae bacterium]|nr:hypothetical protein [Lachnospiraceae bacterium]